MKDFEEQNNKVYSVVISRMEDEDGYSGIDLDVEADKIPLLIELAVKKGHRFEIIGYAQN